MIVPVILAGGVGSRLWPQSRALLPKQFIQFPGQDGSLFQNTLSRLEGLESLAPPLVVCNNEHRFLVAEQLRQLGIAGAAILLEPVGRNTAPAVAMAALQASRSDQDPVLLVLPADHMILDCPALHLAVRQGEQLARQDRLVTFGIVPGAPETGYGYIKKGPALPASDGCSVEQFVEKPDLETARSYLQRGDYLWNSGMFMFRASVFLRELATFAPDMLGCCEKAFVEIESGQDYLNIPIGLFAACPSDSIDYAVMEKTDAAAVVPLDASWNDLGAWSAVWEVAEKDANGNAVSGDVLLEQVADSYIQANSRMVAAVGVSDTVIVETSDAVLVADRGKVQGIKKIVDLLQAADRSESQHHDLVFRPWGSYRSLENTDGYQVKHIIVNPGQSLSLQMHHHRAEHWTIVRGEALVTRDDEQHRLKVNESIFLPLGCRHRLENPGQVPVELIEVQVGDYLGEDDIVRFEDVYGRIEK
jgi:mannose-1-phosphate guanylyltransferase/mannose-6-phosphate isomerase